MQRRQLLLGALAMGALARHAEPSAPATYPSKPIRIVAPFAPGSSDLIARKMGEYASKQLGQPWVIENRPGAQGTIASRAVASASADGYTLLLGTNSTHAASAHLFKQLSYDPLKDFTPIIQFTVNPLLLVVGQDMPVQSVQEFLAFARSSPQPLAFGAGNTGSLVASEMLRRQGQFDAIAVNYQGNAQAMIDFAAGRLDFMVTDPMLIQQHASDGRLKVLGITTRERLPGFLDVAPFAEQGLPDFEYMSWIGLFAPAGVPAEVADALHHSCAKAMQQDAMRDFISGLGMIAANTSREAFASFVAAQIGLWGQYVKDAGLEAG